MVENSQHQAAGLSEQSGEVGVKSSILCFCEYFVESVADMKPATLKKEQPPDFDLNLSAAPLKC